MIRTPLCDLLGIDQGDRQLDGRVQAQPGDQELGLGGQLSLGHGAFVGAGAYTAAITMGAHGWPFPLAILAAAVVAHQRDDDVHVLQQAGGIECVVAPAQQHPLQLLEHGQVGIAQAPASLFIFGNQPCLISMG